MTAGVDELHAAAVVWASMDTQKDRRELFSRKD